MPKELKELKTFIKGTVSTMSPDDIPDESASFSLDLDNTSELGKLQGRYEDWNYKANHVYAHHYSDISRFNVGIDTKPYRDLIFVKMISGNRPSGAQAETGGTAREWITDNANSPFLVEIGILPKWIDGGGVEKTILMDSSTNGDIAMQGSGKAMHIGFGGDSTVTSPKWVGHFGHERFDYTWDTTYPYVEEDWISVEDVIKDFDIIVFSYEDAHIYDESTYGSAGATYHNYITAGRLSGAGLIKIDISTSTPTVVATSDTNYNGLTACTPAWNKWGATNYQTSDNTFVLSTNALVDDSGSIDSESFTGGVGGWSAVSGGIAEGVSAYADKGKLTNHSSNGTCEIKHDFKAKKGDEFTLEIDFLELDSNTTKIEYQVGVPSDTDSMFTWKEIGNASTTQIIRANFYLNASQHVDHYQHSNKFIVDIEDVSSKIFDLTLSIKVTGNNDAVSYIDGIRLIPVCNNVGDSSKIDGYWIHHGGYAGSDFVYGRIVKLNPKLEFEYSRLINNWGHDWMGNGLPWHDGKSMSDTNGYCSQLLQCGEKLWFSIQTDSGRGGFVAAHPKQIQLHDFPDWMASGALIEDYDEQYLHGQIGLLYNVDIPDPHDGQSTITPDNRTPDSSLGCNNRNGGLASIAGAACLIPQVQHPGWIDGGQEYSNGFITNEDDVNGYERAVDSTFHAAISHVSWIAGDYADYTEGDSLSTAMKKSIAYKTYKNSMCRIPDAKSGINWFFSAGSVTPGNLRDDGVTGYGNFQGNNVKLAGYSVHSKFRGRKIDYSSSYPYKQETGTSFNSSLHYLASVGPRYRNVHRHLYKANVYQNYLSWGIINGTLLHNTPGFLDEKLDMDNLGHQLHSGNSTLSQRRINLQELLGGWTSIEGTASGSCGECGRSASSYKGHKYSGAGSVWKSDVHDDFKDMFRGNASGNTAKAAAAEYYRTHGFEDLCTLAPVYLSIYEHPDLHNHFSGGSSVKLKGSQAGDNPDVKYFDNIHSDLNAACGHLGSTSWESMMPTNDYSESFDIDYSATNQQSYSGDHYEDIIGIEMIPYINHKNNIVRGYGDNGWVQNTYQAASPSAFTSNGSYWQGGVKLAVQVSKNGIASYRMPNSPNCYGAGAPNIINLNDGNSDGWSGGIARGGGYTFWDGCRLTQPLEGDEDKIAWTASTWDTAADTLARYSTGHFIKGLKLGFGGLTHPTPYSPMFLYGQNTSDIPAIMGSWGDSLNPKAVQDIHGNINYAWASAADEGAHGDITEAVGASPFSMIQRGWSGQYFNGIELWAYMNLGASGDTTETNTGYEGNIAQGTGANKFSSYSPIAMARGNASGEILFTGNILKPHTTVEAENGDDTGTITPFDLGGRDRGNGVPPGYATTAPSSWDMTHPTYEDLDHFVLKMVNNTDGAKLEVTESTTVSNGVFSDEKYYLYKIAFLYDGNQETPLSKVSYPTSPTKSGNFRDIKVEIAENVIPRRVSHITIYRAESSTDNEAERDGAYRLIKQLPLTRGPSSNPSGLVGTDEVYPGFKKNPATGWYEYKIDSGVNKFRDTGSVGMSYQAINGMPETIEDFRVYYGLSTQLNNEHFIGRCWRPELEGGERYIMKSKPGKFSTFNWLDDWLRLPTVPTALQAYRGRIYAFDESNMYRIDPALMRIEDILEGVGCISKHTITATDFGMIFCDKNNIYLHDGQKATAIGGPILKNVSYDEVNTSFNLRADDGYHALIENATSNKMWGSPRVWTSWSGYSGSFLVAITSQLRGTKRTYIYSYKPEFKRWDKWSIHEDGSEISNIFLGADGETYFGATGLDGTNGSGLYQLLGMKNQFTIQDGLRKSWKFDSKNMSMGQSSQKKKLKNAKILSNKNLAESDTDFIKIYLDGKNTVLNSESKNLSEGTTVYEKSYLTNFSPSKNMIQTEYGNELMTSTDFNFDTLGEAPAGWVAANQASLYVVTGGRTGNCMQLLQTLSRLPVASIDINTEADKEYLLTFWHKDINSTGKTPKFQIAGDGDIIPLTPVFNSISSTDWVKEEIRFTSNATTITFALMHDAGANVGDEGHPTGTAFYFDDFSMKEIQSESIISQANDFYSMRFVIDASNDTKIESLSSIFRRKRIK
jgi:hypothetical protein